MDLKDCIQHQTLDRSGLARSGRAGTAPYLRTIVRGADPISLEYTCINCIRDFSVVKRWYGKYHPYGLDVIECTTTNSALDSTLTMCGRQRSRKFKIPWPVWRSKGSTWATCLRRLAQNRYLIDPNGSIVMKVFGGGAITRSVKMRSAYQSRTASMRLGWILMRTA